jgi:hypothetical protein
VEALEELADAHELQPESKELRLTIDGLRSAAFALSDQLTHRFFTHARAATQTTLGM